jgi:hypothetical protein
MAWLLSPVFHRLRFAALLAKAIVKAFQNTAGSELNRRRFLFSHLAEVCSKGMAGPGHFQLEICCNGNPGFD